MSLLSNDDKASFAKSMLSRFGPEDSGETLVKVGIAAVAYDQRAVVQSNIQTEAERWDQQMLMFKKDNVAITDKRYQAAIKTHERLQAFDDAYIESMTNHIRGKR